MNAGAKWAQNKPIHSPTESNAKTGQASRLSAFSESISIRQNRVIELQQRIQQSKFCPTNDKIAEAMLSEAISISTD